MGKTGDFSGLCRQIESASGRRRFGRSELRHRRQALTEAYRDFNA
jgi:hypothetical protein